ncbi:MAG: hypothetical protein OXG62_13630 [Nitrospinae bacterium]|nr:hypothetical protein [Nitrospinota bacterium]
MGWTLEEIQERHEITEEWLEVFGEVPDIMPVFGPGDLPLFRECLRKKSKQPIKDFFEANADTEF